MGAHVRDRSRWLARVVDAVSGLLGDAPGTVVDLACGTGALARACAQAWPGAHVVGVDADPVSLRLAQLASDGAVATVAADMTSPGWTERLPRPPGTVDALVSGWAWHEVGADAAPALAANVARLLRPGGVLVVADVLPLAPTSPRLAGYAWDRTEAIWHHAARAGGEQSHWWDGLRAAAQDDPDLRAAFAARDADAAHRHDTRPHPDGHRTPSPPHGPGHPPAERARDRITVDVATWLAALRAAGFAEADVLARDEDTALLAAVRAATGTNASDADDDASTRRLSPGNHAAAPTGT